MVKAIRFHKTGGPEVLEWENISVPDPGPGEVLLRHKAIGLNFIDTYHRTGLYPLPLPAGLGSGLGMEAAGVVEAIGNGVTDLKKGDRVAYAAMPPGAYAEQRLFKADQLVPLPDNIDDKTAAAAMLKGMTAEYLLRRTFPVKPGMTVLIHAAAGGVGLIACQWARHLGATVIGTVGSTEKAELARKHGCKHIILYRDEDIAARVRDITDGQGVPVVYDSVGKDTFEASLDCLQPRGMMVSYGNASGPAPPVEPAVLAAKGSLFLTRPTLMHYNISRDDLLASAAALFDVMGSGAVRVEIHQEYELADAATAHRDLEARRTTGASVLVP